MDSNDIRPRQSEQTSKQIPVADNRSQSSMPPQETPDNKPGKTKKDKKGRGGKAIKTTLLVLLVLVLIGSAAYAAYWWRDTDAAASEAELKDDIAALQLELSQLRANADEEEVVEPADLSSQIEAAVVGGEYADLESSMSDPVTVILAASEAYGPQSPEEAVESLEYLDNAEGEWEFSVSDTVLTSYRNGDYGQYFPVGALVANSEDGYVVSFTFDHTGAISGVFMAADQELLTP